MAMHIEGKILQEFQQLKTLRIGRNKGTRPQYCDGYNPTMNRNENIIE